MKKLINELENNDDFEWKVGRITSSPGFILFLLGVEKKIERPVLAAPELMLNLVVY